MTDKEKVTISKFLSLVLRHKPDKAGITLDEHGWADVSVLLEGAKKTGRVAFSFDDLKYVVQNNDKQRFTFSDDFAKIRANQGHTIQVDVQMTEAQPPAILYHGTVTSSLKSILADGLLPMKRLHVHLSEDVDTAGIVGNRRKGGATILKIDAAGMHEAGHKFYLSANGVWLTDAVPAKYIQSQ